MGADGTIACAVQAKNLDYAHSMPIFARSQLCRHEFLDERTNSRADLTATYSHLDSYSGLVELRKSVL